MKSLGDVNTVHTVVTQTINRHFEMLGLKTGGGYYTYLTGRIMALALSGKNEDVSTVLKYSSIVCVGYCVSGYPDDAELISELDSLCHDLYAGSPPVDKSTSNAGVKTSKSSDFSKCPILTDNLIVGTGTQEQDGDVGVTICGEYDVDTHLDIIRRIRLTVGLM